jgi:WXG100 family type VII secretion target
MAGQVSVDHAAFSKANQQYGDVVPAIRDTANHIAQAVDAAAAGWKGEAYGAFTAFHTRLHENITKVNASLQEVSDLLQQGHQTYSHTDSAGTQQFTSL